jgi:hypothetical protein
MVIDKEQLGALEKFIVDNHDLEKLESLLNQFNIFEAVGVTRQELRHSDFLAFLLNPVQTHQLGDRFLKRFLKRVLIEAEVSTVSAIEIDVADLQDSEVRREWRNIDVLIYARNAALVIAIENKVGAAEHSDQLQRYKAIVREEFPNSQAVLIFLSPEGVIPSDESWISYSYAQVADLVDLICDTYKTTIGSDVHTVMAHYSNLIRRHVMSSSDIGELCVKIYKQHRQALDLIYEHRPDLQSELAEFLVVLIEQSAEHYQLVLDYKSKQWIGFAPKAWDQCSFQKNCRGWTSSKRALLFEWCNYPNGLSLDLTIGPVNPELKGNICNALRRHRVSLRNIRSLNARCNHIYKRAILIQTDYEQMDLEELQNQIKAKWNHFLTTDLPLIREAIITEQGSWTIEMEPISSIPAE